MDESSRKRAGHGSISDSEHNEAGPSGNVSLGILPEVSEETTRLFLHLSRKGDMDAITNLISQGIDVNASDCDNRTALHFASCSGHKKVVEFLLQMGANVNAQDRFGSTPLSDAKHYCNEEVCQILEESGAKLPESIHNPTDLSRQSRNLDDESDNEAIPDAICSTKDSKLSKVFKGKELEMLALCLRTPLVSIRVGKIQRQGRLLCPTSLRGYLNLAMLPCSEMQLLFTGDDGVIERIADIKSVDKSNNIALDILDPDPSGRSFVLKECDGGKHFFWQSEKSKVLGDELLGDLKLFLSQRPTLSQLTGVDDSRLDTYVNCLADVFDIDVCTSLSSRNFRAQSSRNKSLVQQLIGKKSPTTMPMLSSSIQSLCNDPSASHSVYNIPDLCCETHPPPSISNCVAVCFNRDEITEPRTGFVDLSTVSSYVSDFQRLILSDVPFSQQLIGLPIISSTFSSASTFLPSLLGRSLSSSDPIPSYSTIAPTYLAPYYCPCPMRASSPQYTTSCLSPITPTYLAPYYCPCPLRSSSQQYNAPFLPPIGESNASSSIFSLNPLPTPMVQTTISLDRVNVSPIPMPVSSLVTIPTPLQASTLPSFFSDPIVHIPVMDFNSTNQSFLVSMPQAISSGGIPPVLPFININSANQSFVQSISSPPLQFPSFLRNIIPNGERLLGQELPSVNLLHGLESEDHRDSSDAHLYLINNQCRALLTSCPKDCAEVADGNSWCSRMENTRSSLLDSIPQYSGPLVGMVPTVLSSNSLSHACNFCPESSQATAWMSGSRGLYGGVIEPGISSPSSITSFGSSLGMSIVGTDIFHISKSKGILADKVEISSKERHDSSEEEESQDGG